MEEGQQCFHPNGQTVISWPNKVDLSHLCRICANSSEYLISIFDGEGTENDLEFKIKKHLPIKISKEEPLPLSLCYQCASTLIAWHDLTLGCIEADKRLRALSQGSCKEESSAQFKVDDNDDNNESFRGASDCEIELEEEVTTTPSTSTQVEIDNLSTSIKVKKKIVNKSTLIKQESEKKQKQVKEDETKENASLIESTSSERCPISSKVIHKAPKFGRKTSVTLDCNKTLNNINICGKPGHTTVKLLKNKKPINNITCKNIFIDEDKHIDNKIISIHYPCKYCGELLSQYQKHIIDQKSSSTTSVDSESEDYIFNEEDFKVKMNVLYQCEECDKSFKLKNSYKSHQRIHKMKNSCHLCGKLFARNSGLLRHVKHVHFGIKDHSCDICGLSFVEKSTMEDHRKTHTGESPYFCHVCNKVFTRKGGLSRHMKNIHLGIKEYNCDFCGHTFAFKSSLDDHRRIHTGEKPYVCDICGKSFKTNASLYIHNKTHTDEFPHSCNYCQHQFRWKHKLVDHLRIHTGEKKFTCDVCGKQFRVKNDLTRHKRKEYGCQAL